MFVDIPAFLAASCAFSGDPNARGSISKEFLSRARRSHHLRTCRPIRANRCDGSCTSIRFDEREDIERLEQGLRLAGLEEDPDDRRPEAVARPVPQEPDVARFAPRRARCGAWTSTGSPSSSPTRRDSAIWRGCSIDRGVRCIASSWPTGRPRRPGARRSSMTAPAARSRRASESCSTRSTTPTPPTISPGRAGPRGARSDRRAALGCAGAGRTVPCTGQCRRAGAIRRDVANPQCRQEDRQGPPPARTAPGKRGPHGHLLRLPARATRRLALLAAAVSGSQHPSTPADWPSIVRCRLTPIG